MRLFIGVGLGSRARHVVSEASGILRERVPGASFVPARNLHMTLAFLGELPDHDVAIVKDWFAEIVPAHISICGELTMRVEKYGSFSARGGLILWAGPEVSPGFEMLVSRIRSDLDALELSCGLPPAPPGPWVPHITLARRAITPDAVALLADLPIQTEPDEIAGITLFRSESDPERGGVRYRPLRTVTGLTGLRGCSSRIQAH